MIATFKHRSLVASTLLAGALFIQTGCAGSDNEQEAELTTDSSQGEATEAQAEAATTEAQAAPLAEAAPTPEAPVAAPSTPPAEATAAAATPAPSAVNTPSDGKARVVRYVSAKEAVLRSAPNDKAAKVGVLPKGERVMVIEENGWGRVSDELYIKLNSLSAKAVPRKREKASWSKPAR